MKLSDLPGGTKPVAAKPNHHVLEHWPIDRLEPPKNQARTHPAKQIEHIGGQHPAIRLSRANPDHA